MKEKKEIKKRFVTPGYGLVTENDLRKEQKKGKRVRYLT